MLLLAFLSTFFVTASIVKRRHAGTSRLALSFSYRRISLSLSLSLSLSVQMSQTRHRAMAAPEITLAPGNVQELSRILQGRKRHIIIRFWWSFDFFLSNNKISLSESRLYTTRVKNTHPLTNDENEPLSTQELCEKTTLEPCPQRQSKHMEEVHIVRKDLVHLRNYALKVVRSFFFFWC